MAPNGKADPMALAETAGFESHISIPGRLARVFAGMMRPNAPAPLSDHDRARRSFVQDMMQENPDAFLSEADVQCMMRVYPGRF